MSAVQELDFAWLESAVSKPTRASVERPGPFASRAPALHTTAPSVADRSLAMCGGSHTPSDAGRPRPSIFGALCFHGSSALVALAMVCLAQELFDMDLVRPSDSVGFAALIVPFGGSLILSTVMLTVSTLRRTGVRRG
ncbi:MAG: hypothetical protein KF708_24700 [Pirellulales bacterium]|nr:hypothetical protein [Pirellulales bacterium]